MRRILVWEDGFCNFSTSAAGAVKDVRGALPFFQAAQPWPQGSDHEREGMSPDLFFKMSHDVYNYGEGYMTFLNPLSFKCLLSLT